VQQDDGGFPGLDRFRQFLSRRELGALRPALAPGERVLHVLDAVPTGGGRRGVLVATDRKLAFATAGFLRRKVVAWRYLGTHLKLDRRVDDATLLLHRLDGDASFTVRRRDGEDFVAAVKARPPGPDDPLDFTPDELKPKSEAQIKVERLQRMLRKGSITKAEYERRIRALSDE